MMTLLFQRIALYGLGALVVVAGIYGAYFHFQYTLNEYRIETKQVQLEVAEFRVEQLTKTLQSKEQELLSTQAAFGEKERLLNWYRQEKRKVDHALQEALQANPAWSRTIVPDSVRDGLQGTGVD